MLTSGPAEMDIRWPLFRTNGPTSAFRRSSASRCRPRLCSAGRVEHQELATVSTVLRAHALAAAVEPFGVRTTLIEPGMVRTGFFDAATRVPVSAPYRGGPADHKPIPVEEMPDSQENTVAAIVRAASSANPPRRLVLGSDARQLMTGTLRRRLADIEAQRDTAATADIQHAANRT
jgi:hypothetical protein